MRVSPKLKSFFGRVAKLWSRGKKAAKTVSDYYDKGKEMYDKHRGTIEQGKGLLKTFGGDKGRAVADAISKGQGYVDKGIRKADEVRGKIKDGYSKVHQLSGGRI